MAKLVPCYSIAWQTVSSLIIMKEPVRFLLGIKKQPTFEQAFSSIFHKAWFELNVVQRVHVVQCRRGELDNSSKEASHGPKGVVERRA